MLLIHRSTRIASNLFSQLVLRYPFCSATQSHLDTSQKPFQFYSFEDDIKKLKHVADANSTRIMPMQNNRVSSIVQTLNSLYRKGQILALSSSTDPASSPSALDLVKYALGSSVGTTSEGTTLSSSDQAIVLETFLHNILLSVLCDTNKHSKSPQQNKSIPEDTQQILRDFIINWLTHPNSQAITLHSVTLFKFLVKTFEVLRVPMNKSAPFIEKYLNEITVEQQQPTNNSSPRKQSHKKVLNNIHDISLLLLPISDYFQESSLHSPAAAAATSSSTTQNTFQIESLSSLIVSLIKKNSSRRRLEHDEISAMCKTLFCLIRINAGKGVVCLELTEALLKGSGFIQLTEIEMTSLIYSITKIKYEDNTLPEHIERFVGILNREMPNLVLDYEIKIEKMLQTRYFHYARVPYILYCLQNSQKYRKNVNQNLLISLCSGLCDIAVKNYDKYKPSEITTIIYSLKSIDGYVFTQRIHEIYRGYFLKLALDQQLQQQRAQKNASQLEKADSATSNQSDLIDDTSLINSNEDEKYLDQHMSQQFLENTDMPQNQAFNAHSRTVADGHSITSKKNIIKPIEKRKDNVESAQNSTPVSQKSSTHTTVTKKTQSAFELLMGVDILCLLMGVRESERRKQKQVTPSVNSVTVINQQLFILFLSRMSEMSTTLQMKIIYEMAYNHSELLDAYLFDKHFKEWVVKLSEQLSSLNNHDLIAIAYIMKKFTRLFSYHIHFWMQFTKQLQNRTFQQGIEISRTLTVTQNMLDFTTKCLKTNPSQNQAQKKQNAMRSKQIETLNQELQKAIEQVTRIHKREQQV